MRPAIAAAQRPVVTHSVMFSLRQRAGKNSCRQREKILDVSQEAVEIVRECEQFWTLGTFTFKKYGFDSRTGLEAKKHH